MAFAPMPLPFPKDSLAPAMGAQTLEYHHDKHYAAYTRRLNELIAGTAHEHAELTAIVRATAGASGQEAKIFNNAAQTWNHEFFWQSLAPNGGGTPPEPVLTRLEGAFQSFETFVNAFVAASVEEFGSGWAWLVMPHGGGTLRILTTHDADNPLAHGLVPLWTCDLWEHAYCLEYQHERARFVRAVIETVANWQNVGRLLVLAAEDDGTLRRPAD